MKIDLRKKNLNKKEKERIAYILADFVDNPHTIGRTINKLEVEIRNVYKRWYKPKEDLKSAMIYIAEILVKYDIPLQYIKSNLRAENIVKARTEIAVALYKGGYNKSQIGRIINKHPTAVLKMIYRTEGNKDETIDV